MGTAKPLIDKDESRRIRGEIRRVFLEVWDPIGIADEPNAQDEYDGYIGPVYELLISRASSSELVDYLFWVTYERMGLGPTRADMLETLEALRRIPLTRSQL